MKIAIKPILWLVLAIALFFYLPLFLDGRIPFPADTLVGSYFPWLDFKWGFPVGVPVQNPPISDAFQFFIWKHLSFDLFSQGILPLWNKYEFSGTPLLASFHTASLFPANLLLFLPRFTGWGLYIFASSLSAGLAMYLYLGRLVKSKSARFAGAIIFAFAGPMTTWVEFGTGVWAAALLPLTFFILDQIIAENKQKYLPLLSLTLAAFAFAGHAQMIIYLAVLASLYVFLLHKPNLSILIKLAFFTLLGAGLASLQLLPTWEFLSASIREEENYAAYSNYGLTPFFEIIRLWVPDFFGHPATYNHFSQTGFYHEFASFIGSLSLPLILALTFTKKLTAKTKFFLAVFFASLILAIDSPLSRAVFSLPLPLLTYSYASRIFFISSLSAAVLVAVSLEKIEDKKHLKKIFLFCLIFIVLTLAFLTFVPAEFRKVSMRNSVLPLGLLTLLAATTWSRLKPQIIIFLLLFLFLFDLGRFFGKHNPFISAHLVFPQTKVIDFLQSRPQPFRIAFAKTNLFPPSTWAYYRIEAIGGYNPLRLLSYQRLFNLINRSDYFARSSRFSELEDKFDPRFLDILNVKYFVSLKEGSGYTNDAQLAIIQEHGFEPVFEEGSVVVWQNPHVLPRAYFVDSVISFKDEPTLAHLLQENQFDLEKTALILGPQIKLPPLDSAAQSKVELVSHQPNQVVLETETDQTRFLILADSFDSGWKATIDGKQAEIYLANVALRGLIVPPGQHNIVFNYFPDSLSLALKISTLSLILLSLSLLVLSRKKN